MAEHSEESIRFKASLESIIDDRLDPQDPDQAEFTLRSEPPA